MNTVLKSVLLNGNIKEGKLSYRPIGNEFSTNYNLIAIGNVFLKPNEPINIGVSISCNYVTNEKFNPNPILCTYEDSLQVLKVKFAKSDEGPIVCRFTPIWFRINSLSEELQFTFRNLETLQEVKSDILVTMTIFFK